MRKELLAVLCAVGLVLGAVSFADAEIITWRVLQDASMVGKGPGPDRLLGTTDDTTTGENNNCNFNTVAGCATTGSPTTGTWSYVELDLKLAASCLSGSNGGAPCTSNADCPDGICIPCPDVAWSYMGNGGVSLGNGTMVVCQEQGAFRYNAINLATTESISTGTGVTCVNLRTSPSGLSTGCGPGSVWNSTADIKFSLGCNPLLGAGQIDNLTLNGRVYPAGTAIAAADAQCYPKTTAGATALNNIRTIAQGKGATFIAVMCGFTAIPNDATTTSACLRGADVWDLVVVYTTGNADICTDPNPGCVPPGSCAGSVAEEAL